MLTVVLVVSCQRQTDRERTCSTSYAERIASEDLIEGSLALSDEALSSGLCVAACARTVNARIADNTGELRVTECEVEVDVVRRCHGDLEGYGGVGGSAGEPGNGGEAGDAPASACDRTALGTVTCGTDYACAH